MQWPIEEVEKLRGPKVNLAKSKLQKGEKIEGSVEGWCERMATKEAQRGKEKRKKGKEKKTNKSTTGRRLVKRSGLVLTFCLSS